MIRSLIDQAQSIQHWKDALVTVDFDRTDAEINCGCEIGVRIFKKPDTVGRSSCFL